MIPRWKQEIRRYLQGLDSTQSVPPLTLINKTHASFPSSPDFNHTVPSNPSLWRSLTIIRTWRENIDEIFRFLATHPPQLSGKSRTPNNRSPDREVLTTLWYLLIQQWNELMVIESSTLSLLSSYLDEDEMLNDIILLSDHWHWLLVFLYQPKEMFTEFMNNLQAIQVDYDSGDIRVKRIVNHWMYRILLIVSPDVYVHSFTRWQSEANQGESATTDEEHVDETTVAILEEVGLQMTSLILSIAFDYKLNEIKSLLQHSVIVRELLDDRRRNVSGCTHTRYPSVLNEINRWNIGWNPCKYLVLSLYTCWTLFLFLSFVLDHFSLLNDTRTADNPTIPLYPQQAIEEGLSYVSVLLHTNKEHFFDPLHVLTMPTKEFSWKYLTFKRRNTRSFGQQSLLTPSRVGLAVIAVTAIGAIQLLL